MREHGVFTGAQREGEMRATSEETHPLQQRITVLEGREREAERRREEAERRVAEAERQAAERVMELERGMQQLQTRLTQSEEAREDAEMGREEERRRKEVAEERVATVAEALRRQEEEEPSWVVRREEIQLTREELGRGGWAVVRVANFRGVRVAAKCLHQQIISDYNCGLFTREMNLAARIRHPNLLLFIGATIRGELIILTELMPTSLRAVLEEGPLTPPQRSSVTLGVAAALNYLHRMRPDPIIHRDISSANGLLVLSSAVHCSISLTTRWSRIDMIRRSRAPTSGKRAVNTSTSSTPKLKMSILVDCGAGIEAAGDADGGAPGLSVLRCCRKVAEP